MKIHLQKSSYYILPILLVVYLIATIKSNGFHHPDEHFQLIEFAGLKAKWNTENDLPWEYKKQVRPSLQPYLAFGIFKFASLFQIENPFTLATVLRAITALFSFAAILLFISCFMQDIKQKYWTTFIVLSFFLWFLPNINIRFSSETWSGLCLLTAVALIRLNHAHNLLFFLIGVLFGLSFEFRFQLAFAISGLLLWLILVKNIPNRNLLMIFLGGMSVLGLCFFLDSLFYGELVFTPYNYFKANIIDGVASSYGVSPWFGYLEAILFAPTFLLGIAILLTMLVLLIYSPKNIVLWAVIPFIFFHSIIPHKELRFLFPIVNFIPYMLIYGYQLSVEKSRKSKPIKTCLRALIFAFVLVNVGGLLMLVFKPAGNGSVNLIYYISEKYSSRNPLIVYCLKNNNPYIIGAAKGLKANFYCPNNLVLRDITLRTLKKPPPNQLFILPKGDVVEGQMLERANYIVEKEGIPSWIMKLNKFYKVFNEDFVPVLYTQRKTKQFGSH